MTIPTRPVDRADVRGGQGQSGSIHRLGGRTPRRPQPEAPLAANRLEIAMLALFAAAHPSAGRHPHMSSLFFVHERLNQANDVVAILDAACDAFETMLSVLRAHEDPGDPLFRCAGDGRRVRG